MVSRHKSKAGQRNNPEENMLKTTNRKYYNHVLKQIKFLTIWLSGSVLRNGQHPPLLRDMIFGDYFFRKF